MRSFIGKRGRAPLSVPIPNLPPDVLVKRGAQSTLVRPSWLRKNERYWFDSGGARSSVPIQRLYRRGETMRQKTLFSLKAGVFRHGRTNTNRAPLKTKQAAGGADTQDTCPDVVARGLTICSGTPSFACHVRSVYPLIGVYRYFKCKRRQWPATRRVHGDGDYCESNGWLQNLDGRLYRYCGPRLGVAGDSLFPSDC